jgi:alpha-amylase
MRLQRYLPPDRWSPFLRNHDQTRTLTELGGDVRRAKLAATLLLTLPGLPFVYYGEEIGMTGNKPDERLRTPMQWSGISGVGFTKGKPWEAAQPDSVTANVASEDADPGSLLNRYRELIHLRASNPALASGELIPLSSSNSAVIAYLRRTDDNRIALVVANLGDAWHDGLILFSPSPVLAAGRYTAKRLLGPSSPLSLRVGADGRISGYTPIGRIAPMETYVIELIPVR